MGGNRKATKKRQSKRQQQQAYKSYPGSETDTEIGIETVEQTYAEEYGLRFDPVSPIGIGFLERSLNRRHQGPPSHPESPERVEAILKRLRDDNLINQLALVPFDQPVSDDVLELSHTKFHIDELKRLYSESPSASIEDIQTSPSVGACCCCCSEVLCDPIKVTTSQDGLPIRYLSSEDTYMNPESLEVAKSAAGLLLSVIDAVVSKSIRRGLALTRPPGHHAARDHGMGFCLINNVGIAIMHLRKIHNFKRVLVVDWDVHHGNGTQEILKALPVLFISIHRFDQTKSGDSKFFPGTGTPLEHGDSAGKGYTINIPLDKGYTDGDMYVTMRDIVIPAATSFKPDFVVISAGFDAAVGDPLGAGALSPPFFEWMTSQMIEVAETFADGRIVFALEGGYNLESLAECVSYNVKGLLVPPHPPIHNPASPTSVLVSPPEYLEEWAQIAPIQPMMSSKFLRPRKKTSGGGTSHHPSFDITHHVDTSTIETAPVKTVICRKSTYGVLREVWRVHCGLPFHIPEPGPFMIRFENDERFKDPVSPESKGPSPVETPPVSSSPSVLPQTSSSAHLETDDQEPVQLPRFGVSVNVARSLEIQQVRRNRRAGSRCLAPAAPPVWQLLSTSPVLPVSSSDDGDGCCSGRLGRRESESQNREGGRKLQQHGTQHHSVDTVSRRQQLRLQQQAHAKDFGPLGGHRGQWKSSLWVQEGAAVIKSTVVLEAAFYQWVRHIRSDIPPLKRTKDGCTFVEPGEDHTSHAGDKEEWWGRALSLMLEVLPCEMDFDSWAATATADRRSSSKERPETRHRIFPFDARTALSKPQNVSLLKSALGNFPEFMPRVGLIEPPSLEVVHMAIEDVRCRRLERTQVEEAETAAATTAGAVAALDQDDTESLKKTSLSPFSIEPKLVRPKYLAWVEMENFAYFNGAGLMDEGARFGSIDIKMGTCFYGLDADSNKMKRMLKKAAMTSAISCGCSIIAYRQYEILNGNKIWAKGSRAECKKYKERSDMLNQLRLFVLRASSDKQMQIELVDSVIHELTKLETWFINQRLLHFASSSILIIYRYFPNGIKEPRMSVRVKVIDFAHISLFHSDIDQGYLLGLKTLLTCFTDIKNRLGG